MDVFFETVIYLIAVFGIVLATYFCFAEKYINIKLLNCNNKYKNGNKKIKVYLYNMDKNEEEQVITKINENSTKNVNINVYKVIDKK